MRVLAISDLHAPFNHSGALDFLSDLKKQHKPEAVVCLGDLGDQHGWSRHERMPDAPGQGDEHDATVRFCRELYKLFPRVKACVGNHDVRLAKKCVRAGIPSRLHRTVSEVYDSPIGWEWADAHVVDGTAFQHGDGFGGKDAALKAALSNRKSTCIGHIHSAAGVQYTAGRYDVIWGLQAGCLVDAGSLGMAYAKANASKPILGTAMVLDGVPTFFPMR